MAEGRVLPGIGLRGFFGRGNQNWDVDMDTNLRLLSALVQLRVASITEALPGSPADGVVTVNPANSNIYLRDAGAWVQVVPVEGWSAYVDDVNQRATFNGTAWVLNPPAGAVTDSFGAGLKMQVVTVDLNLATGKVVSSANVVPDGSLIMGVSARTLTAVSGTAQIYLDVNTSGTWGNQYTGTSGLGIAPGSTKGFCAPYSPQYAQYGALAINACVADNANDTFSGGSIRVSVSFLEMTPPAP